MPLTLTQATGQHGNIWSGQPDCLKQRGRIWSARTGWPKIHAYETQRGSLVVREKTFRNLLAKSRLEVNCPPARAEQRGGRAGRAGEGDRRCRGDRLSPRRPRGQFSVSGGQLSQLGDFRNWEMDNHTTMEQPHRRDITVYSSGLVTVLCITSSSFHSSKDTTLCSEIDCRTRRRAGGNELRIVAGSLILHPRFVLFS